MAHPVCSRPLHGVDQMSGNDNATASRSNLIVSRLAVHGALAISTGMLFEVVYASALAKSMYNGEIRTYLDNRVFEDLKNDRTKTYRNHKLFKKKTEKSLERLQSKDAKRFINPKAVIAQCHGFIGQMEQKSTETKFATLRSCLTAS
jgi:hypothetical protein